MRRRDSDPSAVRPPRPAAGPECWDELDAQRQLELRIEYGHYLDKLPASCSLEEKIARVARWLAERSVRFPA